MPSRAQVAKGYSTALPQIRIKAVAVPDGPEIGGSEPLGKTGTQLRAVVNRATDEGWS